MTSINVPAFVTEDHMPPPNELKFRVTFVYHDEPPEMEVTKYWKNFGRSDTAKLNRSSTSAKRWKKQFLESWRRATPPK